jgi:YesN/AraC family two-component response regulator
VAMQTVPDLVISDIMMPKKDGFELCNELRNHEITSHIPVILLTAKASQQSRIEGLKCGADAYLTKPFSIPMLKHQVENLLESHRKLREQFSQQFYLEPKDMSIFSVDQQFLERAIRIVETHMHDPDFGSKQFVIEMEMSKATLFRKLKSLTDLSTSDFIKTIRLKRAHQLLTHDDKNVTEVCYEVGFNTLHRFIAHFKEQYGVTPKQFAKQVNRSSELINLD